MTTIEPVRTASFLADSTASSELQLLSTPLLLMSALMSAMISDAFPLIMSGWHSSIILHAVSVRYAVAPTPTGSRMTTPPASCFALPAFSIDATHSASSVPMLITSAPAIMAMSATSSAACAITGEAPAASRALALKFIAT